MRSLLCTGCADVAHLRRWSPLGLVLCTLSLISTSAAESQQSSAPVEAPTLLQPGKPVDRELSPKQVRRFLMSADSGSLVRIASTQLGIDIVVSIFGPDGAKLAEVDSSGEGPEQQALAVVRRSGQQRVEVRAYDTTASPGRFSISMLESLSSQQLAALSPYVPPPITRQTIESALQLDGLNYSDAQLAALVKGSDLTQRRGAYERLRAVPLPNSAMPSLFFEPLPPKIAPLNRPPRFAGTRRDIKRPANLEDVAFWSLPELAALVRTRQVSSVELTRMYIGRLHRYDSVLNAVVTFTDSLALEQARRADREIAGGHYRGTLHGIPYAAKDLYAVPGYPSTWGAEPYRNQVLPETATAVRRLDDAGAVLVAKLSTGALANGDVWFRGTTHNPWNPAEGSSGSSAGPAAAVSAGLVPFALGTETLGSIISPSNRTGVTGLRPSYGRVSRAGVMALAWSMDKPGPLCRNADDCAIVFNAIRGRDPADPATVDEPFPYDAGTPLSRLRIGYIKSAFDATHDGADLDRKVLEVLQALGAKLVPIELPQRPVDDMTFVLNVEAAAAFDDLTRSGRDSLLKQSEWPNIFRAARLIPAVEYIQANRVRRLLQEDMNTLLDGIDAYVSPSFQGSNLALTNLTGHPCVAVPDGFQKNGDPWSITFCAPMYGEAAALEVARAYQEATPWHKRHPPAFSRRAD
jgi:Asp-tRNA(Asn)/Glu-tRNA(Gln) amidotransferase A subunit family amidase